jgi:DedD protein
MSFFNLRRGGQSSKVTAGQSAPAESLEIVRKRAKHRLIGSSVLVLLGVIGFPLLFDSQPRPVSVGIPIEIPSKQGAKPLSLPAAVEPAAPSPESAPVAAAAASPSAAEASTASASPAAAPSAKDSAIAPSTPTAKAGEKPVEKTHEKASDKASAPATKPVDDAARAKSLLEGAAPGAAKVSVPASRSVVTASTAETRLVVQVGAFADAAKAREARLKLERAGLKTYTQVAETKDGKRIRVRVGPYATKAEADKAAKQIKALDLPAAILWL